MDKPIIVRTALGAAAVATMATLVAPALATSNSTRNNGPSFLSVANRFLVVSNEVAEEDHAAKIVAEETAAEQEWYDTYGCYGDYAYHYDGLEEFWLSCSYHGTSQAAINAGGVVEFYDHYYAAHNYDAGSVFYCFSPGDIVHIDGYDIVIEGDAYFDYYANSLWDAFDLAGSDAFYFQTCTGSGSQVIVFYGNAK